MRKVYFKVTFDVALFVDDDAELDDVVSELEIINWNNSATMDDYSVSSYKIEECK